MWQQKDLDVDPYVIALEFQKKNFNIQLNEHKSRDANLIKQEKLSQCDDWWLGRPAGVQLLRSEINIFLQHVQEVFSFNLHTSLLPSHSNIQCMHDLRLFSLSSLYL